MYTRQGDKKRGKDERKGQERKEDVERMVPWGYVP